MKPIILFDVDRTLIDTTKFKQKLKFKISQLLNISLEDFLKVEQGYVKKGEGFTDFIPQEYIKFLSTEFQFDESKISKAFFDDENFQDILYGDVLDCLKSLSEHYTLGIFSESFKDFQMLKLHKTGLLTYFDQNLVFIFQRKLTEESLKLLPENCFIIDDNLPVINALTQTGKYKAIWINRKGSNEVIGKNSIISLNEIGRVLNNYNDVNSIKVDLVGDPGIEPGTSSLSEKRSNRLS